MNELKGPVGELRITGTIIRKDTGKVEPYEVSTPIDAEQLKALQDEGILPKPEGEK